MTDQLKNIERLGVHTKNKMRILVGPFIFIILLLLPLPFFNWQEQGALGMIFWMTWWWIDGSVAVVVTSLVPLALTAIVPIAPTTEVVKAYSNPIVFLIAGSCMIGAAWQRWGLGKRIALKALSLFGGSVRKQIWVWFLLTSLFSPFIPDTLTAAIFAPVAASLLAFVGYKTSSDVWQNREASNILLAVGWGASIGSLTTPLGGGQNLIIYEFLSELKGTPVAYYSWFISMLPFSIVLVLMIGIYISFILQPEDVFLPGSQQKYRTELRNMGPMTRGEKYSGIAFIIAVLVAFMNPLITEFFSWLNSSFFFFATAFILFFIPAKDNENVISFKTMKFFPTNILIFFPSSLALAKVVELSGLAKKLIDALSIFTGKPMFLIYIIFIGIVAIITNVATNTAAAALVIPIIINLFVSKGLNPVPLIMALVVAVNLAFALPSGNGCLAISSGYGINLKTMFKHGIIITILGWIITVGLAFLLETYTGWGSIL
jgi:solute carrier family 13 (sodium-dependent dicarboxylate transporter), member 2/3/5